MLKNTKLLIEKLEAQHSLTLSEYEALINGYSESAAAFAAEKAVRLRKQIYGTDVYIRGLIEISNICRNDCLYCGIRRSNQTCSRYRLNEEQILASCSKGYALGFRTFVLQGGEDGYFTDSVVCDLLRAIKAQHPDCAITLSLGERSAKSYQRLYDAGANRYLLRHETADETHYRLLHPPEMSYSNRMQCLHTLKRIGFQTGCGFMVGSPYQTVHTLAKDLKFIETFQPDMCGIGPFIPHNATPFHGWPSGTTELTCYLLSITRLIVPHVLLPATTALGTIDSAGREKGILAGANIVMPNLSPPDTRKKYELYNNKLHTGLEEAKGKAALERQMQSIGYDIVTDRGDVKST